MEPADRLKLACALVASLPHEACHIPTVEACVEADVFPSLLVAPSCAGTEGHRGYSDEVSMFDLNLAQEARYLMVDGARVRVSTFRATTEDERRIIAAYDLKCGMTIKPTLPLVEVSPVERDTEANAIIAELADRSVTT